MQAQYPDFYVCEIATSQSTTSTTYTKLTTPDQVTIPYLPQGALLEVWYQAIWQNTVASNARAAFFIGANQVKYPSGTGAPATFDRNGPAETNDDAVLATDPGGLQNLGGVGNATEVTTGQAVAAVSGAANSFFVAPGAYVFSVQFKNNAAGTLTVKNRHLWVRVNEPTGRN